MLMRWSDGPRRKGADDRSPKVGHACVIDLWFRAWPSVDQVPLGGEGDASATSITASMRGRPDAIS
eukprot:SAG31_NODE_1911_length_6936_cov_124.794501_2_plen_66_part_00